MSSFDTSHLWEDVPDPMRSFASGLDFLKSLGIGADFVTLVNSSACTIMSIQEPPQIGAPFIYN